MDDAGLAHALDDSLATSGCLQVQSEQGFFTESFQLRIHTADWHQPGEGVYESRLSLIEATVSPSLLATTSFMRDKRGAVCTVGRIMFVPPDEPVQCRFSQGRRRTLSCLFDLPRLGLAGLDAWRWNDIEPASAFDIRNMYVDVAVQRLLHEARSPGFGSRLQVECIILFLAAELQRHFKVEPVSPQAAHGTLDQRQLALVQQYIEEGNASPSLTELARLVDAAPQSFSLRFRNTTGITLRAYVSRAKLRRARQLLMNRALMMKQVSHQSGFASPAAFAIAFRKESGITPGAYRQLMFS